MARIAYREIVEGVKGGDRRAIRDLVTAYQERLLHEGIVTFRLSPEDAEEVASDTLLVVVQKAGTFQFKRSEMDFHFWLMAIFRNRVRDLIRQRTLFEGVTATFGDFPDGDGEYAPGEREVLQAVVRKYEEDLLRAEEGEAAETGAAPGVTGEGAAAAGRSRMPAGGRAAGVSRLEVIADVLDGMETWERVLLRCRALDVPYEQIAAYTGKPAKTLKVYHQRVRKKFVKRLAEYFPELAGHEEGHA